jgi:hypothetical protein
VLTLCSISSQVLWERELEALTTESLSRSTGDSVLTSSGEEEAWQQLRKELRDVGILYTVIRDKRELIVSWFRDCMSSGFFEGHDTDALRPGGYPARGSSSAMVIPGDKFKERKNL